MVGRGLKVWLTDFLLLLFGRLGCRRGPAGSGVNFFPVGKDLAFAAIKRPDGNSAIWLLYWAQCSSSQVANQTVAVARLVMVSERMWEQEKELPGWTTEVWHKSAGRPCGGKWFTGKALSLQLPSSSNQQVPLHHIHFRARICKHEISVPSPRLIYDHRPSFSENGDPYLDFTGPLCKMVPTTRVSPSTERQTTAIGSKSADDARTWTVSSFGLPRTWTVHNQSERCQKGIPFENERRARMLEEKRSSEDLDCCAPISSLPALECGVCKRRIRSGLLEIEHRTSSTRFDELLSPFPQQPLLASFLF